MPTGVFNNMINIYSLPLRCDNLKSGFSGAVGIAHVVDDQTLTHCWFNDGDVHPTLEQKWVNV